VGSFWHPLTLGVIAVTALVGTGTPASANSSISGTATYRERMLLPAGAAFEATLEDVSRVDAPSQVIGRVRVESPGPPPFRFAITYDPSLLRDGHRYSVRARVVLDGRPLFTTDTAYPVLGPGGAVHVDMLLRRVGAGIPPVTGAAAPVHRLQGVYSYLADAGTFIDCATGQRMPVAQEGDNAALEAAYSKVQTAPGAMVLAVVDGWVEMRTPMEGKARPTLVVYRLVEVLLGHGCDELAGPASLENTYWKLVRLRNAPVDADGQPREPHLILQAEQRRNRIVGGYTLDGEHLTFSRVAGTMMACPQGMAQERAFLDALAVVGRWRIDGQRLELFDTSGEPRVLFESRYLKSACDVRRTRSGAD
jgi:uncharacterized lipoprotein YbaY